MDCTIQHSSLVTEMFCCAIQWEGHWPRVATEHLKYTIVTEELSLAFSPFQFN